MNKIIYILLFISSSCFSQGISNSVLETFDYEFPSSFELKQRNYPEPYYDSVKKQDIYPPYTHPKTGVVYEYQEPYVDRDPYTGQYLDCIDDKILPIGWSEDGKFYYSIYNYSYGEGDPLRGKIEYILIDVKNNKLIHYDTIENKNIIIENNINLKAELEQFPLKIHDTNGSLIEEININYSMQEYQKLAFSSSKRGEVVIKESIDPHQLEGCPDEVKGYFFSPDNKYLITIFYANEKILGAGGDLCEGSIYFKILDLEMYQIIEKDKKFDVIIYRFWDRFMNPELHLLQEDLYDEDGEETQPLYDDFNSFEEVLISMGKDDKVDGFILADTITVLDFDSYLGGEYQFEENITFSTYINYFTSLKILILPSEYVSIKHLELNNPELEYIKATGKYICIESLDITQLKKLKTLSIGNSCLDSLDVSQNTELTTLYCYGNNLTSLDLSNNPKLQTLYCDRNQIKSLDISNNPNLSKLRCFNNDGCVRIDESIDDYGWSDCISSHEDGADANMYRNEFVDPETGEICFCQGAGCIPFWEYNKEKLTEEQKDCWCFELKKEVDERALTLKESTESQKEEINDFSFEATEDVDAVEAVEVVEEVRIEKATIENKKPKTYQEWFEDQYKDKIVEPVNKKATLINQFYIKKSYNTILLETEDNELVWVNSNSSDPSMNDYLELHKKGNAPNLNSFSISSIQLPEEFKHELSQENIGKSFILSYDTIGKLDKVEPETPFDQKEVYRYVYPAPIYDSINDTWEHPPYTNPKTGVVYEYNDEALECDDPYTNELIHPFETFVDFKPIGWSNNGVFAFMTWMYDPVSDNRIFTILDLANKDTLLNEILDRNQHSLDMFIEGVGWPEISYANDYFSDTLAPKINKQILENKIELKIESELQMFPIVFDNNTLMIETKTVNKEGTQFNYEEDSEEDYRKLYLLNSSGKGTLVIAEDYAYYGCGDGGSPLKIKGYSLSPDKKFLAIVFFVEGNSTAVGCFYDNVIIKYVDLETYKVVKF